MLVYLRILKDPLKVVFCWRTKTTPTFTGQKKSSSRLKHGERLQLRTATAAVSGLRYCRKQFLVMENSGFFLPKWPFFNNG